MGDAGIEMHGLRSAVESAVMAADQPEAVPEQLALLPLRQTESAAGSGNPAAPHRGVGRPQGSKNKRAQAWADYLLAHYTSPLVGLAEMYSRSVRELAEELGFTNNLGRRAKPEELLEILRLQVAAMKELAPYVHQKMPMAVDVGENGLIHLTINAGSAASAEAVVNGDVLDAAFLDMGSVENQGVSEEIEGNSNAPDSNAASQEVENND